MRQLIIFFLLFLLAAPAFAASGDIVGGVFFMGEDVLHPSGFMLAVNEFTRRPYQSGLGGQAKQDEIYINLTLVNTGVRTFNIDPLKDFKVELLNTFPAQQDKEGKATKAAFNVFPSTQSRIDLYFKVESEQQATPALIFSLEDSAVKILCDTNLGKLLQKSEEGTLNTDETIQLGQALIDAGRFSEAGKIVRPAFEREPTNTRLLMQMAGVEDAGYNPENASFYLQQINPGNISSQSEAFAISKIAVKLGFYSLAIAVLEPFAGTGRLETPQKLLLARAYYYENRLVESEQLLSPLLNSGAADQFAWFTMGNLNDKKNDLPGAIEAWEKAVEMDPDYAEAQFNLGVGYFKMQRIDKARECWERVRVIRPDSETLQAAEEALKATEY